MSQMPEVTNGSGSTIKVGTTGTIGSLMTQELEAIKHVPQASISSRRKPQTAPVSVPCGATPKKTQQRRHLTTESGNSSSCNGKANNRNPGDAQKPRQNARKHGHRTPMLGSDEVAIDRNLNRDKLEKKGHAYIVEVVDIKCSNPVSSRLKKLGFSKLSESIA